MEWSIRNYHKWSDEAKLVYFLITGGNPPGKPIKERDKNGKDQ